MYWSQLTNIQHCGWTSFSNNHQGTLKRYSFIINTYKTWKRHSTPGSHSKVMGRESKRERAHRPVILLLLLLRVESRNLKWQKRKNRVTQMVSYCNQPIPLKQERESLSEGRQPGYSSSPVVGVVLAGDSQLQSGCLCEMDASGNQSVYKEGKKCQGLHYIQTTS